VKRKINSTSEEFGLAWNGPLPTGGKGIKIKVELEVNPAAL
jgi:hypothetical protein